MNTVEISLSKEEIKNVMSSINHKLENKDSVSKDERQSLCALYHKFNQKYYESK